MEAFVVFCLLGNFEFIAIPSKLWQLLNPAKSDHDSYSFTV